MIRPSGQVRVYINGTELEGVSNVEVNTEVTDIPPAPETIRRETIVEIETQTPTPVTHWDTGSVMSIAARHIPEYTPPDRHEFVQNERELPARICERCDMWPEYHLHSGFGRGRCVCNECMPDEACLPDGDPVPYSSASTVTFPEDGESDEGGCPRAQCACPGPRSQMLYGTHLCTCPCHLAERIHGYHADRVILDEAFTFRPYSDVGDFID